MILILPSLLIYVVAIYLIVVGLIGLNGNPTISLMNAWDIYFPECRRAMKSTKIIKVLVVVVMNRSLG